MTIKTTILEQARRVGIEMRKYPKADFPTLSVFDAMLQLLAMRLNQDLWFVQVGANDGRFVDPLRKYLLREPWHGVLIEPQPTAFKRLQENYVDAKATLAFEQMAVTPDSQEVILYTAPGDQGDNEYPSSLASAVPSVISRQLKIPVSDLQRITVPGRTVTDIVEKHSFSKLDLLQIDAEGYDFEILKSLDFDRFRPTLLQFETGHLSVSDCTSVASMLSNRGYELYWGGRQADAVAVSADFLAFP